MADESEALQGLIASRTAEVCRLERSMDSKSYIKKQLNSAALESFPLIIFVSQAVRH